jgi:hypothetical protein
MTFIICFIWSVPGGVWCREFGREGVQVDWMFGSIRKACAINPMDWDIFGA